MCQLAVVFLDTQANRGIEETNISWKYEYETNCIINNKFKRVPSFFL